MSSKIMSFTSPDKMEKVLVCRARYPYKPLTQNELTALRLRYSSKVMDDSDKMETTFKRPLVPSCKEQDKTKKTKIESLFENEYIMDNLSKRQQMPGKLCDAFPGQAEGTSGGASPQMKETLNNKPPEIKNIDIAAHIKLIGENFTTIGQQLYMAKGSVDDSGTEAVLLDFALCTLGSLGCLTQYIPELKDTKNTEKLTKILDNIAYIMPLFE